MAVISLPVIRDVLEPWASAELDTQWVNPGDIFSVLLIVGGDVVQKAIAQVSGQYITPASFSFGWVAYAITAVLAAFGSNHLMPEAPDYPGIVINADTGYVRENSSWIVGRLLRDYEYWWSDQVERDTEALLNKARKQRNDPHVPRAGLVISIYDAFTDANHKQNVPKYDFVYWSGGVVFGLQLVLAAMPIIIDFDWRIMMITVAGQGLALLSGLLPQWRQEKWAGRTSSKKNFILTRGNGAQHAIVIRGNGSCIDFEDLAVQEVRVSSFAKWFVLILAILWVALLITAAGVKHSSWFLLAVGGVGMVHNIFVAGWPRRPEAFGIHLRFHKCVAEVNVSDAVQRVESDCAGVGSALMDIFLPGVRSDEEDAWYAAATRTRVDRIKAIIRIKAEKQGRGSLSSVN